jgi:hypothetical protein
MHSPTTTYAGIDWATRSHAVCVIDNTGAVLERYEVEHTGADLATLVRRLTARDVSGVAIERPDGPVIDGPARSRYASSRGPGSTSSGVAGRTVCPTIRSGIRPSNGSPSPRRPESEG